MIELIIFIEIIDRLVNEIFGIKNEKKIKSKITKKQNKKLK